MTTDASSSSGRQGSVGGSVGAVVGAERRLLAPLPLKLVQIVSGYVLIRGLSAVIGRHLLGYQTRSEVSWDGQALRLNATTSLLGREIRSSSEVFPHKELVSIGLERRYPYLLLLLGALGLVVGAVIGVGWIVDGIEAHYIPIAMAGLGALGAGIALDVGVGVLADYVGGKASLLVSVRSGGLGLGRRLRIVGVPEAEAQRFVEVVAGR
ncbi:MAG: hypothetical protein ACI9WU_000210 [Myxococcota bacterium]